MPKLVVCSGEWKDKIFELTGEKLTLGRTEDNGIHLPDSAVSGCHAEFIRQGEHYLIRDLQSRNGTRVNGEQIVETRLHHGDAVWFGNLECQYLTFISRYLDYNATTPLKPEVLVAMRAWLGSNFGNPSSIHVFGRMARAAVDDARQRLASLLGGKSKEIFFTSGGTESNNLAIFGSARALKSKGRHIITCATEHHAVLHACKRLEQEGFEVTYLPVNGFGLFDLGVLERAFRKDTILVSIMSANNETGVRHPVKEIAKLCRARGVPYHCDAVQSFGKERVNVEEWGVDLLSLAAHKFYGPKGVGLLWARSGTPLEAVQVGGFHENERRAGTENVAGIVGMAEAAALATDSVESENKRLYEMTRKLWLTLAASIRDVDRNGHPEQRLGNTLNVSFGDCDGEGLLIGLDLEGLAVSSGSACMVGSMQPSHVLQAMGVQKDRIRATVRFSFGEDSREEDIPDIALKVRQVVQRLREARR